MQHIYTVTTNDHWGDFGEVAHCTELEIAQALADEHCVDYHGLNIGYWQFNEQEGVWRSVVKRESKSGKDKWLVTYEIFKQVVNKRLL